MYPDLIHNNNQNEDNWFCDICLDGDDDNAEEDLAICEMCLVVVHPSCYRRDLYEQDPDDESPWYCQRCNYLLHHYELDCSKALRQEQIPNCMLCPQRCGALL